MGWFIKFIGISVALGLVWFIAAVLIALFVFNKIYFFIALIIILTLILTIYFLYKKFWSKKKIKKIIKPVKKAITKIKMRNVNDIHCHYCKKTFAVKKQGFISRFLAGKRGILVKCPNCGMRIGRM